jgi:hypothetical protein
VSLWNLRLRALLAEQFALVVTVLVVLAAVGGFATYTAYVEPGTTTEERVVSTWETTGSFDHSATVVEENPVFPVGSTLRNRSVYFTRLAPGFNGTYVFGYRTTGDGELTAEVDLALVTRSSASDGTGADSGVLWETRRSLGETRTTTLGSGERAAVPFSFNASAVEQRRDRIARQLGTSSGTVETVVQATVDVSGTVNGERIEDSRTHTLPLAFESSTYRVGAVQEPTTRVEITQPVTVPQEYGPLWTVGGPGLVLVSLGGLAGLGVVRSRRQLGLTDAERRWLRYREDRSEFDEWITAFSLPDEAFDRPRAEAASLGDLVDFAIDTDGGVVESPGGSEYLVVGEEFLYTYTAPQPPEPNGETTTESDAEDGSDDGRDGTTTEAETTAGRLDSAAREYPGGDGEDDGTTSEREPPADTDAADGFDGDRAAETADDARGTGPTASRLDAAALDLRLGAGDGENGNVTDADEEGEGDGSGDAEDGDAQESSDTASKAE